MDMEVIIMVMVMVMDMGSTSMENLGSVGSMVGLVLASLSMENLARDGSDAEDNSILNLQL
jgi:hypothetical protein